MSEHAELGVLYTEYAALRAATPLASLWSYRTSPRRRHGCRVARTRDGSEEYWLRRSDPLLNRILPGTAVSLVFNLGDTWATQRAVGQPSVLPHAAVIGPVTEPQILHVGRSVHALGAAVDATVTSRVFGVPASELVDQIVPLDKLWHRRAVEELRMFFGDSDLRQSARVLKNDLVARIGAPIALTLERAAQQMIEKHAGRIAVGAIAAAHGLGRRQFTRRFGLATGLPPKLFARITRFQAVIHRLLSTDVEQWASASSALGFYDQAHMINEFREFAGEPPLAFFQSHKGDQQHRAVKISGRPCEWIVG